MNCFFLDIFFLAQEGLDTPARHMQLYKMRLCHAIHKSPNAIMCRHFWYLFSFLNKPRSFHERELWKIQSKWKILSN